MAKQSRSNLEGRATDVRNKQILGGNSALLIGQLFLDYIASAATSFDPDRAYAPGELAIWYGRIVTCFKATVKGESPTTAVDKWTDDVVGSAALLTTDGPDFPVLASALKNYVSQRIKEVNAGGEGVALTKADEEMMNLGVNDAAYVTPKLVALLLSKVLEVLVNLDPPTLDAVAKAGTLENIGRTNQLLYLMGGLYLGNIPTTTENFAQLVMDTNGKVWKRTGSPVITQPKVYNFTNGVDYESIPAVVTPLQPNYVGRFDLNNCDEFRGWFVDTNHPNTSPTVRIVRDGVLIDTIVCTIDRTDVRNVLTGDGRLPQGTTQTIYGWSYPKVASDKDGKSHSYEAFGGTSNTKATTDTGAPVSWTCGSTVVNPPVVDPPVVNPPTVNNPPRVVGLYVDQVVNVAGDYLLDGFAGLFADDDALTYRVTMGNGDALMAGIVFTPGDAKPIKVQGGFPNQQQPITIIARDTAGNETPKSFLLTVARPVISADPVTVVSRAFGGDTETIEGEGARVKIVQTMSNGAQSDYTGGGTYRIAGQYPDQMTITTDRNAVGVIGTKETITADVPVTLEFASSEGWTITGPFTVRNKTVATSPIVSQLINDIRVIEGSGGTVQVYDVHADGNWTEVTSAPGSKFELVAPYPNGMYLTFSNTGRAQVQTAGNSISDDVPVKVRYTPASGPVVEGIITVINQAPPTTENPTPDAKPYVEKFAVYIPAQNTNAVVDFLLKIANVAVGTEIQIVWTEFNQRTNSAQDRYFASTIKDDPNSFPNGYKDYNLLNGLFFIPFSATQSHSVQHIKVRIKDASAYLFETTFDPYGLSAGQPKQFYPL